MLFVDNQILLAESEDDLQQGMFKLSTVAKYYNFCTDSSKTKVMAFNEHDPVCVKITLNNSKFNRYTLTDRRRRRFTQKSFKIFNMNTETEIYMNKWSDNIFCMVILRFQWSLEIISHSMAEDVKGVKEKWNDRL